MATDLQPGRTPKDADTRRALLAGASGLVGRALLSLLIESPRYAKVHVLLRRPVADLPSDPKLKVHQIDFAHLPRLPAVDDAFIALGTTIKVAGSEAAFRAVDFDAVVATARTAQAAGARRVMIVSALGADAGSRIFYNRVKGEMQRAVSALGIESVVFAQPSLLIGNRHAVGQPTRPGEEWAQRLLGPFMGWVPARVRPIAAADVARALVEAAADARPGVHVLRSDQMQPTKRAQVHRR